MFFSPSRAHLSSLLYLVERMLVVASSRKPWRNGHERRRNRAKRGTAQSHFAVVSSSLNLSADSIFLLTFSLPIFPQPISLDPTNYSQAGQRRRTDHARRKGEQCSSSSKEASRERASSIFFLLLSPAKCPSNFPLFCAHLPSSFLCLLLHTTIPDPRLPGADLARSDRQAAA